MNTEPSYVVYKFYFSTGLYRRLYRILEYHASEVLEKLKLSRRERFIIWQPFAPKS